MRQEKKKNLPAMNKFIILLKMLIVPYLFFHGVLELKFYVVLIFHFTLSSSLASLGEAKEHAVPYCPHKLPGLVS